MADAIGGVTNGITSLFNKNSQLLTPENQEKIKLGFLFGQGLSAADTGGKIANSFAQSAEKALGEAVQSLGGRG